MLWYTAPTMKEFFNPYRIMYGFGSIALCVALIMNITTAIPFVSYEVLAERYNVSASVVKKDMAGRVQAVRCYQPRSIAYFTAAI